MKKNSGSNSSSSSSSINTLEYICNNDELYVERMTILHDLGYSDIYNIFHMKKKSAFVGTLHNKEVHFIKFIYTENIFGDEEIIYNKLKDCIHPNILKYNNYYKKNDYSIIVSYYLDGKSLTDYLKNNISENKIRKIFSKIISAIRYLHKRRIIHNDLKTDNIMIVNDDPIIIDFDLSLCLSKSSVNDSLIIDRTVGTQNYIAPESFHLSIYSKKSDIWSLGIILYFMLTKKFPFSNSPKMIECDNLIIKKNIFKSPNLTSLYLIVNNNQCNQLVVDLILSMLNFYDSKRPSCRKILNHKWLKLVNIK